MNQEQQKMTSQILDAKELTPEEVLEKEANEVAQFHEFRIHHGEAKKQKKNDVFYSFLMVVGILLFLISGVFLSILFSGTTSDREILFITIHIINLVIGILFFVIGIILLNLKGKKAKNEILITTEMEFQNAVNGDATSQEIDYLDENVPLKSEVKVYKKLVSPLADLEDEEEALGQSKRCEVRNYETFSLTSKELLHRFELHLANHQMKVSELEAENLLSHIAYSRLLLIKDVYGLDRLALAESLLNTFGEAKIYFPSDHKIQTEKELLAEETFSSALRHAEENPDEYCFYFINDISSARIRQLLGDFLPALFDKNNRHKVLTPYSTETYQVPTNFYFVIFLPNPNGTGLYADSEILHYCPLISIKTMRLEEPSTEIPVQEKISVSDFNQVLRFEKRKHSLPEEIWAKIDALEHFVSLISPSFCIGNDVANDMENHAGLYYGTFDHADEIVDQILACDLLPSVLKLLPENRITGEDSLEDYIHEHFEIEYSLPLTDLLFKEYQFTLDHPYSEPEEEEPQPQDNQKEENAPEIQGEPAKEISSEDNPEEEIDSADSESEKAPEEEPAKELPLKQDNPTEEDGNPDSFSDSEEQDKPNGETSL